MDLTHELGIAERLAKAAGQMSLDLQKKLTVSIKPNNEGPVTNADLAIDQFIIGELAKEFPNDRIISEESFKDTDPLITLGRTWFVDPIDGTANYVANGNDFVVMIGLAVDGVARLGVVYQPKKRFVWRGLYTDTYRQAENVSDYSFVKLVIKPVQKAASDLTVLLSKTYRSSRQEALVLAIKPKSVFYQSSVGLKAMLILEGKADLYVAWSSRIKKWDTCAPAAIIKAAGAFISFIDGKDLDYLGPITHQKPIMVFRFLPEPPLIAMLQTIADTIFIS